MNEQLKELYTNLSQKGIGVGDEVAFEAAYNTEEGFKEIFDASKQLGIVPADWDDNAFKSTFPQTTQPEEPSGFRGFISGARQALRSAHEANKEEIRKANGIQTATTGELDRRLIEEAAEAAELVRQEKIATGLTNQDKKDMEELAQLQEQASNPVSVGANGVFSVAMQEPVLNQYGLPTNITKPVNPELENKIEAKKAQMPNYLTRGEGNFESIQINAIERALGTEDGKRLQTTIYNKYAEEFKNSDAYKTMMKDFYAGKVTEDDILSLFTESYGSKINGEFYNEIAREGGLMHEYIKDAEKRLNTRLSAEDAYGLKNEIEIAKAEQEQQYTAEYNEKYKQTFGVYPDDDPLRTIHQKGFSSSGISSTYIVNGNLAKALQFNDKALDLISAVNNNKGFFGGLGDAVTDIDTWDLGISEIARTKSLMDIIDKVTDDKELTKDEQLMFDAALNYFAVSTYYSNKVGRGYKAGQTTGASLPFMIQFVVSSGATAAIDGALKSGASAVTKKIVKAMIKGGMKKTAKAVSSDAATMVGKAIGGAVVSGIDAALLTSTFGIGKIEAGTLQRELGHVITDFDRQTNKLEYKGVEGAQTREEARRNAIIDTYVEYFSEMALANTLSPVASYLGGTKLFKDIAKGDIAGTIIDIWNNPAWKSIRQSTKFGSLPEEVFEEELGGLLRLSASDVNSIKEAGLDLDSQIDIVLGLAPTSIFFGGVGTVSHYGTLWSGKREFRASLTTEEEKQLFDRLMSESRSGEFGELAHNLIRTIVQDTQMSQEAKKRSISSIVAEYHDLLSKETQELADQVTVSGNERIIDDYISQARYGASDNIYQTKDNKGRVLVISDGKIKFIQVRVGQAYYLVADPSKSEGKVKVRYVNNNGTLTDEIEINVADLTEPVTKLGVDEFKKFKLAQSNASSSEQEAFEFEGGMYNTSTGEYIDTKEEYEKKKAEAAANKAPTVETKAHKVNETVTITINGEKKTVKIISNNLTQNEDGSIKGGTISISVDGSPITGERKKAIISQISELFKKEHAKAIEDFNKRKEEANTPVEPTPIVSEEDKSIADVESQKEAERQTILASAQQKKAKKYTPEETVVVLMEQGNDVATRLVGSRINKLHAQIDEINADENKDELEKWEDSKELSDQLAEYEAAVVKWLGQETLDEINAARTAATQAAVITPEIEPTPTPVVAQEPIPEAIPNEEPAPAVEPEEVQPVLATEEIEEPVVTTEEEGEEGMEEQVEQEKEPVDLSSDDIVFVRQDWRVEIARRDENGELRFVDSGKKVGGSWRVMDNKFLVYYNGVPCYALTTVKKVKAFPNSVTIVAQDYTGNRLKVSKWTLKNAEGKKLLKTGEEVQEENIRKNYESLDDFMKEVVYANPKTGIKLTLGQLLSIPAIQKNRGFRGKPLYAFQVEQFLNDNISKEDRAAALKDIRYRISEIAGTWNAYVRINNLTDVVTEDNMTDFYKSMKEAGGYTSNGLKIQTQDFEALNSNDITKNPILQMLVMMDQAKQINLFSTNVDMSSVDKFSTIGQKAINEKEMSSEEIISEIRDIETDRAKSNNNTISKNRYNALKRELKRREEGSKNDEETEVVLDAVSTDDLFGDVIVLAHRINDKERPELLRAAAQAALDGRIEDTSYDDIFPLYIKLELLRNTAKGDTRDNILTVMSAIERSKHADAINEAKRQFAEAANELDARQSAQVAETVEAATEAEDVAEEPEISQEGQVDTTEPDVEISTTTELPDEQKDAKTLKQEIEQLSKRLDSLDMDQEEEFDSIISQIQEKNAELERLGKGYKEERTSGKSSRGIFDNYASDDSMSLERADYMIGDTVVEHAESTKRIIKILKDAGIRVVTFKNEDLPKYVNKKKLEELSDGQIVYGFASNDTIYLNEDHFNPNSPLHEFTHLWVTAYKQAFAKEWQRFVDIANKSALAANLRKPLKDGKASPYAELSADEMASEVLSRYTGYLYGELDADGRTAFENMMQAQTMEENIAEKSLLNRIRNIWKKIISWFDKSIEKEKKEDVIDVAIRNFASKPMETLARGREAVNELKQLAEQGYKVQSTYHGTSVEFDQFDNDFMSTGEGAQAYGWGIYVSQVKDIGVNYAKQDADRKNKTIDFTNYPTVLVDVAVKDYLENADIKNGVRESVDDYIAKLRKQEKEFVEQFIQAAVQLKGYSFIKRDLEGIETFKELTRKLHKISVSIGDITWESEYALEYSHKAEDVSNRISWLQMLTESDKRKAQEHEAFRDRHLYEVNIPADSYLEDGSIDLENSPYIGFDDEYTAGSKMFKLAEFFFQERMDEFAKNELQVFMDKHGIEGDAKDFITLAYNDDVSRTLDNEAKNERKRLADYYGKLKFLRNGYAQPKSDNPLYDLVRTGGEIYDQIASILGSQKDATEWFLYNGIIGVRVSTHATSGKKRDTKNYVIFNEADAHIVNHTAFMIGDDGKLMLNRRVEDIISDEEAAFRRENPTNFDKKFKKMQETLDKGGKNVLSLQEISELTNTLEDDLRQGNRPLVFERIPFEALQKMSANERTLAEVLTIVAQKSRRTSRAVERNSEKVTPEEILSRDGSNRQMEFDIRQYAKEKGIWLNDPIAELTDMYGTPIGEGQESVVWADDKRGVVIKAKSSELYETIEELLEGIVLNNLLLPQNNQHVIAFGYDKDGMFRVIYETPYVELGDDVVSQEEKDSHMESLGFYKIGDNLYTNGVYEVRDLHNQNIVNDSEGNIQITDAVIKWGAGEHYRDATPEELERDKENEKKLDNWVDYGIEFMIGPNPSSSAPTDPTVFDTEAANRLIVKTQKYLAKVANPNVELPEEFSSWKKMVAEAFDRTEGVRWMMNSIEKYRRENGLPELGEGFDVRTMVETMESKVQNETQSYIRNIENRLRDNIRKLAKRLEGTSFYKQYKTEKIKNQSGEDVILTPVQMIERYLIARDSIEREELTGKPRGAADFYQRMGVDMVEFVKAFHSALFSTAEKKKELDELWESIRAATDVVIDRGWESGLISYDEYQDYKKRKFYVPERDFAEVEVNEDIAVEELSYHGRGSNKLAAMKQAKGGESLAANVLANICLLARDAILKANRNKVKKSMYDLLRANTDWCREYHIPIPHQIWYVKNPDGSVTRMTDGPTAEQKQQMREIKSDIRKIEDEIRNLTALRDAATVPSIKDAYDADIQDLKEQVDMLRDMMPYLDEYDTRNQIFLDGAAKNASTVVVYVDGVPTEMLFPNMTIVANALNGTFNKEGEWSWAKNSTNIAASAMTVYNPTFFTVNVVRDIPFIATKGFVEYGFTFPFRFAIELGKKLLTRDLWKVVWTGDASSISNEHLKAFYEGGANTGYSSLPDLKKLKDATKGWGKGTTVTWSNVGDVLSYLNTFSEVWTRAAAYSVVRQMGNSNEEGIRAAKNLSVNFNRKGLGNRFMNAFGSISLFMNAAIQGSCGWMRAFSGNEKTFAAKAWHATRAALGFMLAPAFAGFIDTLCNPDDDENLLWYSDYDRDNYLIMGDRRIPLNEQLKPFWVVGVNIALGMQGRRSTEQIINSIVSSVFTNFVPLPPVINESIVMAVNGATGTKDVDLFDIPANLITPQAIGGVYDLANGVNFMGSKLEFDTGDKPQFIFSENEALTSRLLAKMLYYLGGGSKDVKSKTRDNGKEILFDVNPKQITALRSLLPVGSTFKDITEFMLRGIVEKDFGSPEDYTTIRRFYKPREEEIAMYNIIKEAKAIVKRNSEIKANMKSQLKGGELSSNEAMSSEAGRRLEAALTDTEIKEIEAYIKAYEVYSVARRAREFGLTEEEFLNSLPDETKKQIKDIDSRRPEIARKLLTMTREYKGMEVKNMTWKQGLGIE